MDELGKGNTSAAAGMQDKCLKLSWAVPHSEWLKKKNEYYIVKEVIEVDELDEGNLFVAAGKQDK